MKKKIIALSVALVLVVAAAVSATLAYFTDEDNLSNEYVIGDIDIDAWEDAVHTDAKNNKINEAMFDINRELEGNANADKTGYIYDNIFPGDTMEKIVTVDNTGANGAYVAIAVTRTGYKNFNRNIDGYYEKAVADGGKGYTEAKIESLYDRIFTGSGWMNIKYDKYAAPEILDTNNKPLRGYPETALDETIVDDQTGETNYFLNEPEDATLIAVDFAKFSGKTTICTAYKGNMLEKAKYNNIGDNCLYVYYYYIPANKSVKLDFTMKVPADIDENSINAFSNMEVNVRATAIQAQGFASAKEAFVALAGVYPYNFTQE